MPRPAGAPSPARIAARRRSYSKIYCNDWGNYALNIPLDSNGQFKLQVYADGFAPITKKFDEFQPVNIIRMARAVECQ